LKRKLRFSQYNTILNAARAKEIITRNQSLCPHLFPLSQQLLCGLLTIAPFVLLFSHLFLFSFSHPGYFGKVGMRYFHKTQQQFHCPTVNVDRLWTLVSDRLREQYAKADGKKDKVPVIDVSKFGFYKVLGNGPLPAQPVIVKAKFFSKKAERKIKAVGGVAVLTA